MAKRVKQVNIIKQIADILATNFKCTVYSDEVLEGFSKPCFFIKFVTTNSLQTVHLTSKTLSVILTYFPRDEFKNEMQYLIVLDKIQNLFQKGIKVKDRYLHTEDISETRVGEEQDILQITINLPYLDKVISTKTNTEIIEDLQLKVHTTEGDKELWQS